MPRFVAFLRAINLGPRRKFPMDAIQACVERAGGHEVQTHINSGNVLLTTRMRSRARVEAALEEAFSADRGFAVPTIAFTPAELKEIVAAGDGLAQRQPDAVRHYVTLLKEAPTDAGRESLSRLAGDGILLDVVGRSVHVLTDHVLGQGGPQGDRIERLVGMATTRNQTVLRTLVQKWC